MKFEKWQALGNDYIILEERNLPFALTPGRVKSICAAHFGCHSDGILLLSDPENEGSVARLRIFNPDGSEAELSGNGAREAVLYLRHSGWTDADTFTIDTEAGPITPEITSGGSCRVDMGQAALTSKNYPGGPENGRGTVEAGGEQWQFQHVSIGNPQCVIEAGDRIDGLDLAAIGPDIEGAAIFPNRTNVAFIKLEDEHTVRARIFERGVGETLSSGTGASASAIGATLLGCKSPVTVKLDGGELTVEVGNDLQIHLTGWAKPVFAGEFSEEFVNSLKEQ